MTKALLIVTAIFEVATGLALIAWPSEMLALVLGPSFVGSAAGVRIAGGVLFALGMGCWLRRDDGEKPNGRRLIATLLAYNLAVALALAIAAIAFGLSGALLWPAVVAHAGLAAVCIVSLRSKALPARSQG